MKIKTTFVFNQTDSSYMQESSKLLQQNKFKFT